MSRTAGRRGWRVPATVRGPLAVTLLLLIAINLLGLPLRTDAAPFGIVSLQFAADAADAAAILTSWDAVPGGRLLWAHALDVLLPFAYAVTLARATSAVVAGTGLVRGGRTVTAAAVVAAVADQLENAAMSVTLLVGPRAAPVALTAASATVKFLALITAVGGLVVLVRLRRAGR